MFFVLRALFERVHRLYWGLNWWLSDGRSSVWSLKVGTVQGFYAFKLCFWTVLRAGVGGFVV